MCKRVHKRRAGEGRHFKDKGMPVVAFGLGNYGLLHSYNEHVTLEETGTAYNIYCEFLSSSNPA